ncbi:terminase small subunit [Lactobacillus sp. AN1001]
MKKLTPKQKAFADEYIKTGNATQAAIQAGYSDKTARFSGAENLTKPNIKSYIDAKMAEIESHKIADAKEVLEFYTAVMRGDKKETVFVPYGDTYAEEQKEADIKTRLSAAREIMKRYPNDDPYIERKLDKLKVDVANAEIEGKIKQAKLKAIESAGGGAEEYILNLIEAIEREDDKEHGVTKSDDS